MPDEDETNAVHCISSLIDRQQYDCATNQRFLGRKRKWCHEANHVSETHDLTKSDTMQTCGWNHLESIVMKNQYLLLLRVLLWTGWENICTYAMCCSKAQDGLTCLFLYWSTSLVAFFAASPKQEASRFCRLWAQSLQFEQFRRCCASLRSLKWMNYSCMTYMTNCAIPKIIVVCQSLDLLRGPEYWSDSAWQCSLFLGPLHSHGEKVGHLLESLFQLWYIANVQKTSQAPPLTVKTCCSSSQLFVSEE